MAIKNLDKFKSALPSRKYATNNVMKNLEYVYLYR